MPLSIPEGRGSKVGGTFDRLSYEVSPMKNLEIAIRSLPRVNEVTPICDITVALRLLALANDSEGLHSLARVAREMVSTHSACMDDILTNDLNVGDGDDIHRVLEKMRKSVQGIDRDEE